MVKLLSFRLQERFNPFVMLSLEGYSETRLFRHFSNDVFRGTEFRKHISYEGYPFLKYLQNLIHILKMQKKIQKKFFVFEIIASELVALNCLY